MKFTENERKALEIQEFRYSIIAEMANPYLPWGNIRQMIKDKAQREYVIPYSTRRRLSEACIKKWYLKFKKYGKPGLLPKQRSDQGKTKVFTGKEQEALIKVLEKDPFLSATAAVRMLQRKGIIHKEISSSSLSRFIRSSGMDKRRRRLVAEDEKALKFQFFSPLECVQADCMHAFPVPDLKGKKRKAILLVLIDDATRRILYASLAFTESALVFEKGIIHVLKCHGRIGALYTDNGSTFVSNQTRRILDILGIPLFHSRPGRPQGKGKNERFFRTLRDQFLRPLDQDSIKSLADLNTRLNTWIETEYHRNPHSGLGNKTPLETWLERVDRIIRLDPTINLDDVFLHEAKRKVTKDNAFTLNGTYFEVPVPLPGQTIRLLYDPHLPKPVPRVFFEGKYQGDARIVDSYANSKVKRNKITNSAVQDTGMINTDSKFNFNIKAGLSAAKTK